MTEMFTLPGDESSGNISLAKTHLSVERTFREKSEKDNTEHGKEKIE